MGAEKFSDIVEGTTGDSRAWALDREVDLFHGEVLLERVDRQRETNHDWLQSESGRGGRVGPGCRLV